MVRNSLVYLHPYMRDGCVGRRVGRKTWNDEGHNLLAEVHASILQQLQIVASYATKHIDELHMDNED